MQRYVICVDDEREVLKALARDLVPALEGDYEVETCESAAEADALMVEIDGAGGAVALVISDQVMPEEDGVHFLERLHARRPGVRKVVLTGYAGLESAVYGINRAGLDRYVEKPWQGTSLLETVRELLEAWESEHPDRSPALADHFTLADFQRRDGPDLYAKVEAFGEYLDDLRDRGLYLNQRPLHSACRARSLVRDPYSGEEREMIMMASNNYLGLSAHPKVMSAAASGVDHYGGGSGAVPLLSGTLDLHQELERRIAAFKGGEDCMLFPSGFAANMGIISALARETDTVFLDHLVHASIVEGAKASGARIRIWRHNDTVDLEKKILAQERRAPESGKLIVVDGVYSMDGDVAPMPGILEVARQHGARVMVDEAHSTGVLGETGRGIGEHFGIEGEIDIVMGTLSKALGSIGGFCVAPRRVVDYVRHYARSYIFSTSLPPATAAAVLAGLDVIGDEPELIQRVNANADHMRRHLKEAGLDTSASTTPIIPIVIGDQSKLWRMGPEIHARGVYLNSVFFPAVPRHLCRLRITVMATHTAEDIDEAADVIIDVARRHGVIRERPRRELETSHGR